MARSTHPDLRLQDPAPVLPVPRALLQRSPAHSRAFSPQCPRVRPCPQAPLSREVRPSPTRQGGGLPLSGASPTGPGPALRASPDAVCGAAPAGGMRPARPPGGGSPAAPLRLPAPQVRRASPLRPHPPPASRFRPGESRRPSRRSDRCRLPPAGTGPSPHHGGRPPPLSASGSAAAAPSPQQRPQR